MPYSRESKDWEQLVEVIEHLAQEIPAGRLLGLAERIEMEDLLR
jgi:hypothetical protein